MGEQTKPLIVEMFVDHDFEKWFDDPKGFKIIKGGVGQMSLVAIYGNAYFHWNSEANGPGIYRHHNLAIEMGEGCWLIEVRGTDISTDPQCWNDAKMFFVSFGGANQFEQTSQWIPITEEMWNNFGEKHQNNCNHNSWLTQAANHDTIGDDRSGAKSKCSNWRLSK